MSLRDLSQDIWDNHRGKLLGTLLGLFIAVLIIWVGFLWAMFILVCMTIGYLVGKRMDDHKENLAEVLDRFLPPGSTE